MSGTQGNSWTHQNRSHNAFYEKTRAGRLNPNLQLACDLLKKDRLKVAVDCGCGAGRDAAFLLKNGFKVHAFDKNAQAIRRCKQRFEGTEHIILSQTSFEAFDYPRASLVLANASLFFCPPDKFGEAWTKIIQALVPSGVFFGKFLGPKDSWVQAKGDIPSQQNVLALSEPEAKSLFSDFEIVRWSVFDEDGQTVLGNKKHWHVFSVVAVRKAR